MVSGSTKLYCYSQYKNQPKQHGGWLQNKARGAQQHSADTTANPHLVFKSLINSWKENLPRAHKTSINCFWITKFLSCRSCQVRAHTWAPLPCSIHWALSLGCLTSLALRGPSLASSVFPGGIFDAFSVCLFPFFSVVSGFICIPLTSVPPRAAVGFYTSHVTPGQLQAAVWDPLSDFDRRGLSPLHPRPSSSPCSAGVSSSSRKHRRSWGSSREHEDRDYSKNVLCVTTRAESSTNAESMLPLFQLLTKHIRDNPSGDVTISSSTLPDFYLLFFLTRLT